MEKLTRCRMKTTRMKTTKPALVTGKKGAIMEKLTCCRIKTTRPALATGDEGAIMKNSRAVGLR